MKFERPLFLRSTVAVDVAVAAVVGVFTVLDALYNVEGTRQADGITLGLVAISITALLWRRRWPIVVAAICMACLTAWFALGHYGEIVQLPTFVALYTVAVAGNRRLTIIVGCVALAWSASVMWIAESTLPSFIVDSRIGYPSLTQVLWPVAALALGESVRSRRELLAEHAARAKRAEADRERETQQRVREERVRIARELHDIVAHTVAGINVQAGVAVDAFDARPEVAWSALQQVRASGREALVELRATVAILRDRDANETNGPVPHLDQIDDLVERTRSAGVEVTLRKEMRSDLPTVIQLAAYRIVQEALTNVIRHAHARRSTVSLTEDGEALTVEIRDDGGGSPQKADAGRGGFGLIGMAERAAAVGGRLEHGPTSEGGFRVHAVLPIRGDL